MCVLRRSPFVFGFKQGISGGAGEGALGSEINLTASVPETRPKHNRLKSEQLKRTINIWGN